MEGLIVFEDFKFSEISIAELHNQELLESASTSDIDALDIFQ